MRGVSADSATSGLGQEDPLHRHAQIIALALAIDVIAGPGRDLPRDADAVGVAKLGAQAGRNDVQGRLAQRRALDGIERPLVRAAVFLEAPLEQDGEGRFAAGRRSQQQQEPSPHIGSRGRGLEIIHHASQGLIHAEQLALEQLAGFLDIVTLRITAVPQKHVPDVLVTGAREGRRARGQYVGEEICESSLPALRAVLLAESVQRVQEIRWTGLFF